MHREQENLVGERFPALTGRSLSGQRVSFPRDVVGRVAVLVVAFERRAQEDVDTWTHPLIEQFGTHGSVAIYEVPMIQRWIGRVMGRMIDAGMRQGVPADLHDNVVTYYGDLKPYFHRFGVRDHATCLVFLLDREGIVQRQYTGPATEDRLVELLGAINALNA